MAKGKEKADTKSADEGSHKPPKSKMLVLVVIVVLILAAVGGGAWVFLGGSSKKGGDSHERPKEESLKPIYVALERKTYNLSSQDGDHFLMLAIDVRVADDKIGSKIKSVMPDILNGMLMLVSSKNVEDLSSLEGKRKFSEDVVKMVNESLHLRDGDKGATDALFTEFVIQ